MFTPITQGLSAMGMSTLLFAGFLVAGGATAACTYLLWIRPWHLRWGASDEEVARSLPGDDTVKCPTLVATRAITINALPEEIWPWLVQVGCKRAGWYSYDWIDNLGTPSAESIVPELQNLRIGDTVPMSPNGKQGMQVKLMDPSHSMLWVTNDENATWAWRLYESNRQTRLVTRVRMRYRWFPPWMAVFNLLFDPGDFVMMRKMLLGLKRRAEFLSQTQHDPPRAAVDSGF